MKLSNSPQPIRPSLLQSISRIISSIDLADTGTWAAFFLGGGKGVWYVVIVCLLACVFDCLMRHSAAERRRPTCSAAISSWCSRVPLLSSSTSWNLEG
jgi:hypothetical protein